MSRSISSLNWTLLYASPRSIATATVCSFLWSPSYTLCANAATFSHVHFLGLNPLICREYLPVLEVSGEFPDNYSFHELPNGVLHCEYAVSIQFVVVFPWFGNKFQETVCPLFVNIAFALSCYIVYSSALSSSVRFLMSEYRILSVPDAVSSPLFLRASLNSSSVRSSSEPL